MRDNIFKDNPVDRMHKNRYYKNLIQKSQHTVKSAARTSGKIFHQEAMQSPAIKILKHALTSLAPKSFQMTMLKMKIHMQTLIGNVFGFSFKSLEANKGKLEKVQKAYAKDKGYISFYKQ